MLYGGLNIINSNLKAKNYLLIHLAQKMELIYKPNIELDLIKSSNILSDAVDSDSSNLKIGQIF